MLFKLHDIWYVDSQKNQEFSRLESWSRDVSRPVFTSTGLSLGLEPRRLRLRLGSSLQTKSWNPQVSVSVSVLVLGPWRLGLRHSWSVKLGHNRKSPATSATVERIFSHSGLLMQANRARMGDNMDMLSQLVYLRCNNKL